MGLDMWLNRGGEEVKYWRKSNAIHKWFVDHVQDGVDDCGSYSVTREQLLDLLETCNRVLFDHSLATELLPPQSGFFFGSSLLDEDYFKDLADTKQILEKELAMPTVCLDELAQDILVTLVGRGYTYNSSW